MFFDCTDNGYILRIRVSPNASKCAIVGVFRDVAGLQYLKVALVSVPEKGKANQELIKFLAKQLNVSKSSLDIISGETDRYKKIRLSALANAHIESLLYQMEHINDSKGD